MVFDCLWVVVDVFYVIVGGFWIFWGGFRWLLVVPCFSNYGRQLRSLFMVELWPLLNNGSEHCTECFSKSTWAIVKYLHWTYHIEVTTRTLLPYIYILELLLVMNKWMNGVWELTFLSLTAWRQVPELWLQKRLPGRNLGEHGSARRSGKELYCSLVVSLRMQSFLEQ